jgi:MoaA/NifB/PqqE/SkfB family radical SAM enzyme
MGKKIVKRIKKLIYPLIENLRLLWVEHEMKKRGYHPLQLPDHICKRGVIYVNMVCNLKCRFCYYAFCNKRENYPLKDIKRRLLIYKKYYGLEAVDITGGEPTIHPNIVDIVRYCNRIGIKPTIITNGQRPDVISQLIDAGLDDLLISFHDLKDHYDNLVRVKGAFDRLIKTIQVCKKKKFSFRTNTTVTKLNIPRLCEIALFLKSKVKPRIHNWILFNPHEYTEWSNIVDIEFQPRYSVAARELKKAIDILKPIWSNVRYIPLCFMKGYEQHVCNFMQWQYDPYEWEYRSISLLTNFEVLRIAKNYKGYGEGVEKFYNYWSKRITRHNVPPKKCLKCANIEICRQQYPQYIAAFGDKEFRPYKGKKILDPMFYREKFRKYFSK